MILNAKQQASMNATVAAVAAVTNETKKSTTSLHQQSSTNLLKRDQSKQLDGMRNSSSFAPGAMQKMSDQKMQQRQTAH